MLRMSCAPKATACADVQSSGLPGPGLKTTEIQEIHHVSQGWPTSVLEGSCPAEFNTNKLLLSDLEDID